jgi:hypothetical protein
MSSGELIHVGDQVRAFRETLKEWAECEILDTATTPDGSPQYFVQWANTNMRWSEWLRPEQIDTKTLVRRQATKARKMAVQGVEDDEAQDRAYFGRARNIEYLRLAHFRIRAWYFSPVPEPFDKLRSQQSGEAIDPLDAGVLYCCEFCMTLFATDREYTEHCRRCDVTHPPGDEIYRCGRVTAWEVDGQSAAPYCTNLCLITKLFLYHKAQYYFPQEFHFYIACLNDIRGAHPIGFFSKEKKSENANNLACILSFPCYQRMGVGRFLVQLSYEFSKIEKRPGSPERPLSDLGLMTYRSYWKEAVIQCFLDHQDEALSVNAISTYTGMTLDDIKTAIKDNRFLRTVDGELSWAITTEQINEHKAKLRRRLLNLNPNCVRWIPHPRPLKKGE